MSRPDAERIASEWASKSGARWVTPLASKFEVQEGRKVWLVESNAGGKGYKIWLLIDDATGEVLSHHERRSR